STFRGRACAAPRSPCAAGRGEKRCLWFRGPRTFCRTGARMIATRGTGRILPMNGLLKRRCFVGAASPEFDAVYAALIAPAIRSGRVAAGALVPRGMESEAGGLALFDLTASDARVRAELKARQVNGEHPTIAVARKGCARSADVWPLACAEYEWPLERAW